MPDTKQELQQLVLTEAARAALPLGYSRIYISAISSRQAERAATVYSSKYRKSDLFALEAEKPVSRMGDLRGSEGHA